MARPLKEIDGEQVYKLAKLGCTQEEIADFFGCARSVITVRFATEYTRARSGWKQSLRRAQTIRAIKDRSDNMLIHLGKSYLGQDPKKPSNDELDGADAYDEDGKQIDT